MRTEGTAAALARTVTGVPGVRGIEPGIASALRTLDTHLRGRAGRVARFGIVVDDAQRATIEVGLDGSRPVRQVVRDIQAAVIQALHQPEEHEEPQTGSRTGASGGDDASLSAAESPHAPRGAHQAPQHGGQARPRPSVTVRVQSLSA